MKRTLWTQSLTTTYCPAWPCPVCKKGTVSLVPKSVTKTETINSKRARSADEWDPEWIEYTFTAWSHCGHPSCKQAFAISGTGGVDTMYDEEGAIGLEDVFHPKSCHPMPDFFEFPAKCPEQVEREMRAAFSLFWSFRTACAGRIRVALECLLNHLGIPKRKKISAGKYQDITLHRRIDEFAKKEPVIGAQLMALKWLGNSGSHDAEVSNNDLLDAFEIMEHALGEIIEKRSKRVLKLAKALTQKHGN